MVDNECEFVLPAKRYLDYLAALEKSPHTLENYCRHLCLYFTFLEQIQRDWQQVTPDDLVRFVQWLRDPHRQASVPSIHRTSPLSERSVNTIVTAVSSFYRYHIQRGETLRNPVLSEQISNRFSGFKSFLIHTSRGKATKRVIKLKEPKKRLKTVKDADFETFLAAIDNPRFRCMVLLMREGAFAWARYSVCSFKIWSSIAMASGFVGDLGLRTEHLPRVCAMEKSALSTSLLL